MGHAHSPPGGDQGRFGGQGFPHNGGWENASWMMYGDSQGYRGGGGPLMMRRNSGLMRSKLSLSRAPLSALVNQIRAGGQFNQAQFAAAQRNLNKTTDYNKAVSKREDEYHCYARVAEVSNSLHQVKFPGPLQDLVLAYDDGTLKFDEEKSTLGSEEQQANFPSLDNLLHSHFPGI
jgi:hypothetical protein